jgi:hypothetical protein
MFYKLLVSTLGAAGILLVLCACLAVTPAFAEEPEYNCSEGSTLSCNHEPSKSPPGCKATGGGCIPNCGEDCDDDPEDTVCGCQKGGSLPHSGCLCLMW